MLTQLDEFHHPVSTELVFPPTLSASTSGTARSGREAGQSLPLVPHELRPPNHTSRGTPGEVLEGSSPQDEGEGKGEKEEEEKNDREPESANSQNHSPGPLPLPREESEPDQSDPEPNVMEPQSDRRGTCKN